MAEIFALAFRKNRKKTTRISLLHENGSLFFLKIYLKENFKSSL